MIRINKSLPPNPLTIFAINNPNSDWRTFRDWNSGKDYKEIQNIVFSDQSQLCAYCEVDTGSILLNKRIEHFASKSLGLAHHTDWFNIFGVCVGGIDYENTKSYGYHLPANLSCDAHKGHFENTHKSHSRDWNGIIINPLTLPMVHNFFSFDKSSGQLFANNEYCENYIIDNNKHNSTLALVTYTLDILNLNCLRLCSARRKIFFNFEKQIKQAHKTKDLDRLKDFAIYWLSAPVKEFQTTRNIILRENRLVQNLLDL